MTGGDPAVVVQKGGDLKLVDVAIETAGKPTDCEEDSTLTTVTSPAPD